MTTHIKRFVAAVSLALMMQSAHALDLVEALEQAQQHDALLQAAQAQYLAAIENEPQSTAALLPSLNLDVYKRKGTSETTNATGSFNNGESDSETDGYSVSLIQPIYNQQLFNQMQQSEAVTAQALAAFEAAKQDLIIRLATAYFDVLAAQDNLSFATAEKKANKRQLEQAQERFKVGMIAITDVKEVQARYDTSVANEIIAKNDLDNAREALWVIINTDADRLNPLVDNIPLIVPEPMNMDAWLATARDSNLALRAAQYGVDAAQNALDSSRAEHYPTLNLSAEYSDESRDGSTFSSFGIGEGSGDVQDTAIALNLNVPIYSGGVTNSKVRQSAALLQSAKAQMIQEQRTTTQLTRTAYLGVQSAISTVKARKQALASTQTAMEATQAGYDVGTRTSVDVLQIQGELFRSERDYARSRYDYILNVLKLKQAAGTLAPEDVAKINQWLEH